MIKEISFDEKIFVAGATGLAGGAICRSLLKAGYGQKKLGGALLTPDRNQLNLLKVACINTLS